MSPRGFSGTPRFGTRAFMGTFEFRLPVIPVSIVEVVKVLKLGSPTFALISDFGNTFSSTQKNQEMMYEEMKKMKESENDKSITDGNINKSG